MILTTGTAEFDDISLPAAGKSEFGMDTLTRKTSGERSLLPAYLASLAQGQVFEFNGVDFFLQSWDPNDATPWASVALYYKGLVAGVPAPVAAGVLGALPPDPARALSRPPLRRIEEQR